MLVLTRRRGEIIDAGDIKIVVVDIRGDKVRIGIEAPQGVAVNRREITKRIEAEGRIREHKKGE